MHIKSTSLFDLMRLFSKSTYSAALRCISEINERWYSAYACTARDSSVAVASKRSEQFLRKFVENREIFPWISNILILKSLVTWAPGSYRKTGKIRTCSTAACHNSMLWPLSTSSKKPLSTSLRWNMMSSLHWGQFSFKFSYLLPVNQTQVRIINETTANLGSVKPKEIRFVYPGGILLIFRCCSGHSHRWWSPVTLIDAATSWKRTGTPIKCR